jgi:hypothetical protein
MKKFIEIKNGKKEEKIKPLNIISVKFLRYFGIVELFYLNAHFIFFITFVVNLKIT